MFESTRNRMAPDGIGAQSYDAPVPRRDRGPASTHAMRSYWDGRARENALWFIQSNLSYTNPDVESFWQSGDELLDTTVGLFGLSFDGNERVLDIGCGIGRVTRALARRAGEVVGLDVSLEMVKRARAANLGITGMSFVLGDGRDLGMFADGSFDVCYSFVVFQHIPDPEVTCRYVREMGRVLRPGGWAVFQVSEKADVHRASTYRFGSWRL